MALSLWQRIRLSFRIWLRRRDEVSERRRREFVSRETGWSLSREPDSKPSAPVNGRFDLEGLQLAWLDDSGAFTYFLDLDEGDVEEIPSARLELIALAEANPRLQRVPTKTPADDDADRRAFIETREGSTRIRLATALTSDDPAMEFRNAVARDRNAERAWYAFRNERSLDKIGRWLESVAPAGPVDQ